MKSWSILLAAAFTIFFTSSQLTEPSEAKVGSTAPVFSIKNESGDFSLSEARGKYVLLSFWSLNEPQSRVNNAQYASLADSNNIHYVSINTDSDTILWSQIVEIDNLNASRQYSSQDSKSSDIIDDYHLATGSRAYLINPDGIIEAVNPSLDQLVKLTPI